MEEPLHTKQEVGDVDCSDDIVIQQNVKNIMSTLVSKNVQPMSFNVINGSTQDLIKMFGASVTDRNATYLPHLVYSRHDRLFDKKKKLNNAEVSLQAGNVLCLHGEQYLEVIREYGSTWIDDYVISSVRLCSPPDPHLRL